MRFSVQRAERTTRWVRTSQSANFTMKTPQSQPFFCSGMLVAGICFHSDTSSVMLRLAFASSTM
jgi:hypothetical protein